MLSTGNCSGTENDCSRDRFGETFIIDLIALSKYILVHNFLQESPVVCRAAFLLELSAFVKRCANFDWPKWMSDADIGSCKSFAKARRERKRDVLRTQACAGRLFHMWAEVC